MLRAIGEVLQNLVQEIQIAWRKHTGTHKMDGAASVENRAYEIETAVNGRLSEMLEVKLAVRRKVYKT